MEGEEAGKSIQPTCVEVETTTDENGEDVEVYYLDVPDSEDPQVLDITNITNILSHEGIQIVETDGTLTEVGAADDQVAAKGFHQNVILELEPDGTICRDQSAAQSAEALLHLAKSHGGQTTHRVGKMLNLLEVNQPIEVDGDMVETEQISEPATATYVLDENGTMVPLAEYRETHGSTLFEMEGPSAQAVAACNCWCGRDFYSQEDLEKHQQTHGRKRSRGSLKCELCSQVFTTSSKLASHHRVAHPDGMPWECPVCFRRFSKKLGLKVHLRAHTGLKQHKCSYCERSFSYKNALLRHIRLHTKDKPYKCTICGEVFAHMWAMRRHRAVHKPKQLFQCEICSKMFKQKTTLFIHARIHTGNRPYTCEICRKAFTLKSSLKQHLRIHTGERPKVCPICGKAFRQTSTLRSHMSLHNHDKPHKCAYCRKRFVALEELKEHEGIHISNKSWQCDECGMRFKNQSLLARHVRKHTNERPFQCKVCGKSFCQSGSLQSHMRTHTKEKPYQCRICPKTYTTSGTLLLHIRKAHNLEAKSVKDVFPSTEYVEDQKVFTIPLRTNTTMNTSLSEDDSVMSEVLGRDGVVFEEVVEGSHGDLTSEEAEILAQRIDHHSKDSTGKQENMNETGEGTSPSKNEGVCKEELDGSKVDAAEGMKKHGVNQNLKVKDLMRKRNMKPGSLLMNIDASQYKIIDEKENSLYAQARQEAALGLAELSLVGGVVVSEKKAGTAYRTLARGSSNLESLVDPAVTKIILSKEGGVMNSQDPHQCPDCKRIFGRKSIMVEHRRIHTDEKPYKCDYCPSEFRQSAQLSCHIVNKHTKEKRYHCTFCQKKFLSRGITIRHITFHHKLKLRVCESMCPGWKMDDAIFVEKKEHSETEIVEGVKEKNRRNLKIGKRSDITILNSLAGLGSPTVKVKFGTDKKKVALKSAHPINVATIEYCSTNENESQMSTLSVEKSDHDQLPFPPAAAVKKEEPTNIGEDLESQETVIGTWYVCETCAMQFNTMDSLRWHLRQVHNTTLAESDVSYVFEDEPVGNVTKEPSMLETTHEGPPAIEDSQAHTTVAENVVVESNNSKPDSSHEDSPTEINKPNDDDDDLSDLHIVKVQDTCRPLIVAEKGENKISLKSTLKCTLCSMYFCNRLELEEHLMGHKDEDVVLAGLHRCDTCGVVMKNTQQVTRHIRKVHGCENIYGCSICNKEFLQESSVLRHIKFFHKWEMKIRGEGNIPVLLKQAPEHMRQPGSLDKDKAQGRVGEVMKRIDAALDKKLPKNDVKVTSRYENDMTFISLEVGDLDHLQLYREDGQEVRFEVVSSTVKSTVIRIKDPQSGEDTLSLSEVIEDSETTSVDKQGEEKVAQEVVVILEDDERAGNESMTDARKDPKVSVVKSPPSKNFINQDMQAVHESEVEIESTPKVVVMKEQSLIPAIQENSQEVIEDSFNKQIDVKKQSSTVEKVKSPGKKKIEKMENPVAVEEKKSSETLVLSPIKTEKSSEGNSKNVSVLLAKGIASYMADNVKKDQQLEVVVVEKCKGGESAPVSGSKTSPMKTVSASNSKVRTISVLNKSPSDIVGKNSGDTKTSPVKKAVVSLEREDKITRKSFRNPEVKNTETASVQDDSSDIQLRKRERQGKVTPSSSPVKKPDNSSKTSSKANTLKPQTVSQVKQESANTTPKPIERNEQAVSQSRSGRVIKRKRFADEEFETTPKKHQK